MRRLLFAVYLGVVIIATTVLAMAAAVSENDSTQPRGAETGFVNEAGQSLDPVEDGFRAPARFDGEITPTEDSKNPYRHWVGSIMANAMRDPAFMATLNVANKDFINFLNSLDDEDHAAFLVANNLPADATEDILPMVTHLYQRNQTPVGWQEVHAESPASAFPFLEITFPGKPLTGSNDPELFNITAETEMKGIHCDSCHPAYTNGTRKSLYDGREMAAGNVDFFMRNFGLK